MDPLQLYTSVTCTYTDLLLHAAVYSTQQSAVIFFVLKIFNISKVFNMEVMYLQELCILLCTTFLHAELNVIEDRRKLANDPKLSLPDNF
jgi:hypothetical protein